MTKSGKTCPRLPFAVLILGCSGTQRISALKDLPHDNSRCNVDLCKGTQFSDAQAKNTVQEYTAGQEFSMTVDIRAVSDE